MFNFSLARLHSRGTTTSSGMLQPMNRPSIPATWAVGEFTYLLPYGHYTNKSPFKHCSVHPQGQSPPPYYAETQPSFCDVTSYPTPIPPCLYPACRQVAWRSIIFITALTTRNGNCILLAFSALTSHASSVSDQHRSALNLSSTILLIISPCNPWSGIPYAKVISYALYMSCYLT